MKPPPGMTTILVVDDDLSLLRTVERLLKAKGYKTLLADSGVSGLEIARANRPDLIMSDIQMDRGDGYSFLEELRKDSATLSIPLILMTGQASNESMRQGMALGADDYLTKPFSPPELFGAIEARLLRHHALSVQARSELHDLRKKLSLMLPHELNTPLTGIVVLGEHLKSSFKELTPSDLETMGDHLVRAGERLRRLIQNFLLYSETELLAHRQADVRQRAAETTLEVSKAIEAAAQAVSRRYKRPEGLCLDVAPELYAQIAPELLGKVVDEVLDNAFKFSPSASTVFVRAAMDSEGVKVTVADQGCGMRPEQIAVIGPFVQFDRDLREQQGCGLGLTIAKRIIAFHQGDIAIRSDPAAGTIVEIRLPKVC